MCASNEFNGDNHNRLRKVGIETTGILLPLADAVSDAAVSHSMTYFKACNFVKFTATSTVSLNSTQSSTRGVHSHLPDRPRRVENGSCRVKFYFYQSGRQPLIFLHTAIKLFHLNE